MLFCILTRGSPKGGVLSPLIWNINFDSLLDSLEMAIGFADDGALPFIGPDPSVLADLAQRAVNRALEWGKENKLSFAPQKTEVVLFTQRYKFTLPKCIKMNGKEIPYSTQAKYLGVIFDQKLTFKQHILNKVKKAKSLLIKAKSAIGQLWGPKPSLMRWAYTGIVRPMLIYGNLIWATRQKNSKMS